MLVQATQLVLVGNSDKVRAIQHFLYLFNDPFICLHPGNSGGIGPNFNGPGSLEQKRAALSELREKALQLHNSLKLVEQHQLTLSSQRPGLPDATFLQRASVLEQDIAKKRAVLTKWNMMLTANGMPSVGGNNQGL
jgi:hypothetical protein